MAKTTKEFHNCPNCDKVLFRRGDRRERWCRKCSYIKIANKTRGQKFNEEIRQRMSQSAKKRIWTPEERQRQKDAVKKANMGNQYCKGKNMGENNKRWIGGKGSDSHRERVRFRDTMQKKIFTRDNYTCQLCLVRGGALQVDHILSWAKNPDKRFNMDNCRTLCSGCHYKITFGREKPTHITSWGHNFSNYRTLNGNN